MMADLLLRQGRDVMKGQVQNTRGSYFEKAQSLESSHDLYLVQLEVNSGRYENVVAAPEGTGNFPAHLWTDNSILSYCLHM